RPRQGLYGISESSPEDVKTPR
ncbi:unnamed protein product, partial [Rotaria magnacalcarata]